jgi:hypothetical protein
MPRKGTTRSTWSAFVRKPRPMRTPASASHRGEATSTARSVAHAPSAIRRVSSASGLLNVNISAATGVDATTTPATSPPAAPNWRRTVAWTTPTVATPMSTCGKRMLKELRPKSRTDNPITQREAGGLSTVIELAASELPERNASQLRLPAWAAAE